MVKIRYAAALLGGAAALMIAAPQAGAATHVAASSTVASVKATPLSGSALRSAASSASFALDNAWTGMCMDLPNYGSVGVNTPVSQYYCNTSESADNQDWHTVDTRVVNGVQLFEFVNDKSNLCLDLPNYGSDPAGTHLYVYNCNSTPANDNQEWSAWDLTDGNGNYLGTAYENFKSSGSSIVNPVNGGQCLDVSGFASTGADGAPNLPLTIYNCFNSSWVNYGFDDHLWVKFAATS